MLARGGGKSRRLPGGGGYMSKKFHRVFSLWGHFLRVVGLFHRIGWGGGGRFWSCPPRQFCVGAPCHMFYCTDNYNLSRLWRFEFIVHRSYLIPSKNLPPTAPPEKINLCSPSHGQHFCFSHYYPYPIKKNPPPP